jgi:HlyD family secretion protein
VAVILVLGTAWAAYRGWATAAKIDAYRGALIMPVKRGDLLITVVEEGNLESAKNLDIKCQVPGSLTILEIVTDGSHVKQGDLLLRLDSSSLEDAILTQQIAESRAEAAKITAEKNFAAAQIAVEEYRQGTFVQELEQLRAAITVAKQSLSSAGNLLFYSKKMHRSGYVTQLEVESKEFAVEQARLNLAVAELKKDVLEKFTRAKMLEDLTSKRDSAEALMKSQRAAAQQESTKLKRLQVNRDKCVVYAPQDGMVIYANDMSGGRRGGGQDSPKIELGAQVRQFQAMLRMPDVRHMQVKTLVHESKVDQVRRGQRARIRVLDREFQGEVASIANQPEAANRYNNNVKEYATIIAIDGQPDGVKPGMTAELEILVEQKKDVLSVPVQCVVEKQNKYRAWAKTPFGAEPRDVMLGVTDDVSVEIVGGLKEGEQVLLNPRAVLGPNETIEPEEKAEQTESEQRFGTRSPAPAAAEAAPREGPLGPRPREEGAGAGGGEGRPGGGRAGGGRAGGGRAGGGRRRINFKELDKNSDGKVSLDEMPEDRRERFGRMDTDGDGFIDQDEQKALEERMRQLQPPPG